MPTQDYLYVVNQGGQAQIPTPGAILIVVPASFVQQNGLAAAQSLARRTYRVISGLYHNPPPSLTAEQRALYNQMMREILITPPPRFSDRFQTYATQPGTLGEILSIGTGPPPTNPSFELPTNLTTVIHLNPDQDNVETQSRVFRESEVFNQDEPGVTLLEMGTNYINEMAEAGAPSLISGLMTAGLVASGLYDSARNQLVDTMVEQLREDMHLPGSYYPGMPNTEFIQQSHPDRAEFNRTISLFIGSEDMGHLLDGNQLATTVEMENGLPLLSLELTGNVNSQTDAETGQHRFVMRPELRLADLRFQAYQAPELGLAQEILLEQFNSPAFGTLQAVIDAYNQAIYHRLGPLGEKYVLNPSEDMDLSEFSLIRNSDEPVTYTDRAAYFVPYANIVGTAFEDAMPDYTVNGRTMDSQRWLPALRRASEGLLSQMGILETARPELRAFAFQLFFDTFQYAMTRADASAYKVMLLASPEDVVYSVLTDAEVRQVKAWYANSDNRIWLMGRMRQLGLVRDAELIQHSLDNIFITTTAQRLSTGPAQLEASGIDHWYSPVPDGTGRLVAHSHPSPQERQPFTIHDNQLYVMVDYLSTDAPLNQLADRPSAWLYGNTHTILQDMTGSLIPADPYAVSAARFTESVQRLTAGWDSSGSILTQTTLENRLQRLITEMGTLSPPRDSQGRLSPAIQNWWNQVHRASAEIMSKVRAAGFENIPMVTRFHQRVLDRFGVDFNSPPLQYGRVSFEDGAFVTWRGRVTAGELGIPANWRPGMAIEGYSHEYGPYGSSWYTAPSPDSALGTNFALAWTGQSWPSPGWSSMDASVQTGTTQIQFTDSAGQVQEVDVPRGGEMLGTTHLIYTIGEQNPISVVADLEYYAGLAPHSLSRDIIGIRTLHALITRGSRTANAYLTTLLSSSVGPGARYADGTEVNGLDATLLEGRNPTAFVIHLDEDVTGIERSLPETGSGELRVMGMLAPGDNTMENAFTFLRNLYELRNRVTIPTDVEMTQAEYTLAHQELVFEHAVARELGLPLRTRLSVNQIEPLVDASGATPLLDQHFQPISPQRAHALNLLIQKVDLVIQIAERAGVDLMDVEINYDQPREAIDDIIWEAKTELPDGTPRDQTLERLGILERSAHETLIQIQEMRLREADETLLRQPAPDFTITPESVLTRVMEEHAQWQATMNRLITSREAGALVNDILDTEISALEDGLRTPQEIVDLLNQAHSPVRDLALSKLLEAHGRNPDIEEITNILDLQDAALERAWIRGTLSQEAHQVLALRLNQIRLSRMDGPDPIPGRELVLDPVWRRFLLEMRVPDIVSLRAMTPEGEIIDRSYPFFSHAGESLAQTMSERPELSQVLARWRNQNPSPTPRSELEVILATGGRLPSQIPAEAETILVRMYRPGTDKLVGIGLAIKHGADNAVEIRALEMDPSFIAHTDNQLSRSLMVEMVRAIYQAHPNSPIRLTPGNTDLVAVAVDLGFNLPSSPSIFSATQPNQVSTRNALTDLRNLQAWSMEAGLGHLEVMLSRPGVAATPEMGRALADLRTQWSGFLQDPGSDQAAQTALYNRLRNRLGDLAGRLVSKGQLQDLISPEDFQYLELLSRSAPHASIQQGRAAYVSDPSPVVVVQLENDGVARQSAEFLTQRYGTNAAHYRLDDQGRLVLDQGRAQVLNAESKIILVGHGDSNSVSGYTAEAIAELLSQSGLFIPGMELRRISVVACTVDDPNTHLVEGAPDNLFGEDLIRAAEQRDVTLDSVTTRSDLVMVDEQGRKWIGSPDEEGKVTWTRNGSGTKLLVERMADGSFMTTRIPVGQGLVETREGTPSQGLGPKGDKVVRFINGQQVDENGLPLPQDQQLSAEERAAVEALMGQSPTGSLSIENNQIRVLSLDNPIQLESDTAQAAQRQAVQMIADLESGTLSPGDFSRDFRTRLNTEERVAVCNELLHQYGERPDTARLRTSVNTLESYIRSYFTQGRLSVESRQVAEVLLEHYRIEKTGEIQTGSDRVSNDVRLDPQQAAMALETNVAQAPALMTVTGGPDGGKTFVQRPDVQFTHEIYALNSLWPSMDEGPPLISEALYQEVLAKAGAWREIVRPLGDTGYYDIYDAVTRVLERRAVFHPLFDREYPTRIVITRDPDGAIAAMGIHSREGKPMDLDYFLTDARLRLPSPPPGDYWVGAGWGNRLATIRYLHDLYPDMSFEASSVNPRALQSNLKLYFYDQDEPQLDIPANQAEFEAAARSLFQRKTTFISQAVTELEAVSRVHGTPEEQARITQLRTRLTRMVDDTAAMNTMARFREMDTQLDSLRTDLAGAGQSLRLAHADHLQDFGANIRFVDQTWQPTTDSLHTTYGDLVSRLRTEGMVLSADLANRPGTLEDFTQLITAVDGTNSTAYFNVLESRLSGSPAQLGLGVEELHGIRTPLEGIVNNRAQTLSTLLAQYDQAPTRALAETLGRNGAWILKLYQENRLSSEARLTVESLLEQVRLGNLNLTSVHDAQGGNGNLYFDAALSQVFFDTLTQTPARFYDTQNGVSTSGTSSNYFQDQTFTLTPDTTITDRLTGATRDEIFRTLTQWRTTADQARVAQSIRDVYRFLDATVRTGVSTGFPRDTVHLLVTRGEDGQIAAFGLYQYNHDTHDIWLKFTATNPELLLPAAERTNGRLWRGAGAHSAQSQLADALTRYPNAPRAVINPENVRAETIARNLFFSASEHAQLFTTERGAADVSFTQAQRSLIEREFLVLNRAVTDLVRFNADSGILTGSWAQRLTDMAPEMLRLSVELDDADTPQEVLDQANRLRQIQYRFSRLAQQARSEALDGEFEEGVAPATVELMERYARFPAATDTAALFNGLVTSMGQSGDTITPHGAGSPEAMADLLVHMTTHLSQEEFARHLTDTLQDIAAGKISPEAAHQFVDTLMALAETHPAQVADALKRVPSGLLQDIELGLGLNPDLDPGLSRSWNSYVEALENYWAQDVSRFAQVEVETLQQSGQGESFDLAGANREQDDQSRLVRFNDGEPVDEYGLPYLPTNPDRPSNDEITRIRDKYGHNFTGRVRIAPHLAAKENPGDLTETNPELTEKLSIFQRQYARYQAIAGRELPNVDVNPDAVRLQLDQAVESAINDSILTGKIQEINELIPQEVRAGINVKARAKALADSIADAAAIRMEVERDHFRLMKAVTDQVDAQNARTGEDWVLVPDSIVFDGDEVRFQVVRRSDVEQVPSETAGQPDEYRIPDTAERVRFTVNTEGLLKSKAILESRKAQAEQLNRTAFDAEGNPRTSVLSRGVGYATTAGGLALAGVGLLQAIRGIEDSNSWQAAYGITTSSYFAGHAGVGILAQAAKSGIGKAIISGATELVDVAGKAAIKGIAMATGRAVEEVAEIAAKAGATALRAGASVAGVLGEIIPFAGAVIGVVMMGMDAYNLFTAKTDIQRVQYGVDLVMDGALTVIDLIGAAFPPAQIVTAPLAIVVGVVRMIFDSAMVHIAEDLDALPENATTVQKVNAVFQGIVEGVVDLIKNLTPWGAVEETHKIMEQHAKDLAYINALNDPTTYFGIHPVDGVLGERAIDFQVGDNSMLGGGITAVVGDPGQLSTVTVSGVPENQLTGSSGNLSTHSATWSGLLPGNTDYFVLGFGESYDIQVTRATAHMFWAIPVHSETVIAGMTANDQNLFGNYTGNNRDNVFLGPLMSNFQYHSINRPHRNDPRPLQTDAERRKQLADMRATLSVYHYDLSGNGGNDTFIVGGGHATLTGGSGADTYVVKENIQFVIDNDDTSADAMIDTLSLGEIALENLELGIKAADHTIGFDPYSYTPGAIGAAARAARDLSIGTTARTRSVAPHRAWYGTIDNFLSGSRYQHLQLRTSDGYMLTLDGEYFSGLHRRNTFFYTVRDQDIKGIYLQGRTSANFDARSATADVLVGGSGMANLRFRSAGYATGWYIPYLVNRAARYNTLNLTHLTYLMGDDRVNTLHGNALDNFITGGGTSATRTGGFDRLYGHQGNDILKSGTEFADNTYFYGGEGDDTHIQSGGWGRHEGGEGADRYVIEREDATFYIHENADDSVNSVKLNIAYDELRTVRLANGALFIQQSVGNGLSHRGTLFGWGTEDINYEVTTKDGWILGKNADGTGFKKIGFEASTHGDYIQEAVAAQVPQANRGFTVTSLAAGRAATARVSEINFFGGRPTTYTFNMGRAEAILQWFYDRGVDFGVHPAAWPTVRRFFSWSSLQNFTTLIRNQVDPPEAATGLTVVNDIIGTLRERTPSMSLPSEFLVTVPNSHRAATLSDFFGDTGLGTTAVDRAVFSTVTGYVWLEAGRHDFRLASSMLSRLRVNGNLLLTEGHGVVEKDAQKMIRYASFETETAGYHAVELTYRQGTGQVQLRDDARRSYAREEHYLSLEVQTNNGPVQILGRGDHTPMANLNAFPSGLRDLFAGRNPRNGVFIDQNFENGTLVRISGTHLDDRISGNALDNILSGGGGNDILMGRGGADIYSLDGDSVDTIRNFDQDETMDTTYIDANRSEISLSRTGTDDLGIYVNSRHIGTVENWFRESAFRHMLFHTKDNQYLQYVTPEGSRDTDNDSVLINIAPNFADAEAGVSHTLANGLGAEYRQSLTGSDHDDMLTGNDFANRIAGLDGNDTLRGGAGNDQLFAGRGNDILVGGEGTDSYILTAGDGDNTIRNTQTGEEMNILRIYADKDDITLTRSGNHLRAATGTGEDAVSATVENWFIDATVRHLMLFTDDGYLLTPAHDTASGRVPYTAMAMDLRHATQGQTVDLTLAPALVKDVTGSAFADTLIGDEQDNLFIGNGGADTLRGGGGSDTYIVERDAGTVTIDNTARDNEQDMIVLNLDADTWTGSRFLNQDLLIETNAGTSVRLTDYRLYERARDVLLSMNGSTYRLDESGQRSLMNQDLSQQTQGQTLTLAAGASGARGSEYNDHLTGNALDNHLDGGEGGMDVLSGRNGADVYGVDIEMVTSATRVSSLAAASTEIQAAGGRLILVDDQGTDEQVGTLQLREGSLSEVKTLRVGNHLYIYRSSTALADLTPGGDILIPAHAVVLPHWFANAAVRHMVIADDQGFTADILDDGSIGPVTVINDGNQDGVTRDLSQGNAFRSVVKISDSPGNDTYTGNDKDNLFVLSQGARETVTGGNGQDTYYITDLDTTRRITLTNGGQDGKTDLIYVNDTSRVMNFSGYGTDTVHMQIGEVFFTLNVDSDQEEAPFSVITTDGFTYKVKTSGRLVVDTVDISQQTTEVLDIFALGEPQLATHYNLIGWTSMSFYAPRTAWGAKTLRGGVNTRLLGGDDNDNTLIVLNTREQGVTLRGRGGSDVYMTGATGTYIIDNQDTDGAQDTLNLMHDFRDLVFTRDNNDLLVANQDGSFSLRLLQYMSQADDGDQYRHIAFLTQDKVGFSLYANQIVEDSSPFPVVISLDLSDTTDALTLDLRYRTRSYGNAYMAVSEFIGSKTAAVNLTTGNADMVVTTGSAADTITTGQGKDIIRSDNGDDLIYTGQGDDMIFAGAGDDHVEAGDGDDVLIGNKGADWLYGGSGSDSVLFDGDLAGETGVVVNLLTGKGQGGDAEGDTYVSIENVYGTWYQDELIGNNQANVLSGGAGFDTLVGHGGNDIFLTGEGSANSVDGGEGSDLIRYADFSAGVRVDLTRGQAVHLDAQGDPTAFVDRLASIEDVEGSKYTDTIIGNDEDNRVLGSLGTDTINLGTGTDVVDYRNLTVHTDDNAGIWVDLANAQPVVVAADGSLSAYLVQALSNVETVYGSSANDRIYGTANADVLAGYKGLDILRGRGGNDTFYAWGDGDAFYGGTGTDTVDYLNMAEGVVASLRTGHGQGLDDFHDIENLSGTLFNDVLEGNSQANLLYGGLGLDVIRGLGGNDTLMGIGDGDLMDGGDGIDTVTYADANTGVWVTMGTEVMDIDQRHQWEKLVRRPDFLSHVETVVGSGFGDLIETSTGSETIRSGQGNDWIIGSMGSDTYDGGEGTDTVSFTDGGLTHGVEINLGANTARDRHSSAFTHTLANVEQAQGSEHDDRIIGNTTGNDLIFASQGQDRIEARTATVVDFSRMYTDDGIAVSVETGTYGVDFDIQEVESTTRITGSAVIKGSLQADTFVGGAGDDHFQGGKGNDALDGGTGTDILDGGEGDDRYVFERGDGSVRIIDGKGNDTLDLSFYSTSEIGFYKEGQDLIISAANDTLRIENQNNGGNHAVDRIVLSNGRALTGAAVDNLITAMTQFSADNSETVNSVQDVRNSAGLMSLAASAWQ